MNAPQAQQLTTRSDPGLPARHLYDWTAVAEELRADPDHWREVFKQDRHSLVIGIRSGDVRALSPHLKRGEAGPGFTSQTRNNKRTSPRVCDLYLRYVPEGGTA